MSDGNKQYQIKKKEVSLMGLFGKEELESLQKKYADATDFSFSITDFKGDEVTDRLILNRYCEKKKQTGACENCRMTGAFAAAKAAFTNEPYLFECEQGLVEAAIPIIVNNQYLGAVLCGRVRCYDKEKLPDLLSNQEVKKDRVEKEAQLSELYYEIPEFSYDKIKSIATIVNDYFKEKAERESLGLIVANYEHKEIHLNDLRKKNASLTRHAKLNDLKSVRAILLPQTLLNMMVTISNYAILENAEQTEALAEGLSGILRYYVEYEKDHILLYQEIQQIEEYLKILTMRYGDRLKVRIPHTQETERQILPKLTILPLVERMVYLSILSKNYKGTFYLDTTFSSERCVITLQYEHAESDIEEMGYLNQTGNIMDETSMNEQIDGIHKRLEYSFGDDYSLRIQNDMIVLDIPRSDERGEVRN